MLPVITKLLNSQWLNIKSLFLTHGWQGKERYRVLLYVVKQELKILSSFVTAIFNTWPPSSLLKAKRRPTISVCK